jgi:crossover junction endodeoxyribonuclease RusA
VVPLEVEAMTFTLPWPPSLNRYYRTWKGRVLISSEGRAYKLVAALKAKASGVKPMDGGLVVRLELYRPQKRGDLDNTLKALFDSLNGVAWVDDGQVVELHATRHDDKANPRVEVTVEAVHAVLEGGA